ncbi:bacillithiol biosynthesis cysteine-adding enzyme BshC [Arachidicoccus rhizosphaerae]|uniref:Putative cysteine ligase BshC n=1 Tax=Arachidicoccus rhizosphaerae TaxID=551991 RepID=A0A1H4AZA6_9BACT|nr:bacillithiol biosynthesis cysteine-adding enzyme BshC [Arachidicoccus rhizosphaerae]SEA41148.1 bacillithiol biosynthesis cysteine-adding enzyme BshC [Arachidicoccus rhizosphaerae]
MAVDNKGKIDIEISKDLNPEDCPPGTYLNIDYAETNYFSKIALDYIQGAETLRPFYEHLPNKEGLEAAIQIKQHYPRENRQVLVDNLRGHYNYGHEKSAANDGLRPVLPVQAKVQQNIEALLSKDTFAITTAHQPVIFGGPLYLIYKILHVIQLAEKLNDQYQSEGKYFVPFYYMGSEDADLEEIGQMQVDGKLYKWETAQSGPVGRMLVDKALLALIDELYGQIGVQIHGPAFIRILKDAYQEGRTIQQASFAFIHQLFGHYGLLILMPDDGALKKNFEAVVVKELKEHFSHKALENTTVAIEKAGYKVQTHGRPINLFYQPDHERLRIIDAGDHFEIEGRTVLKSSAELLKEVKDQPALFSGNVVLRGPFQETVLPDIAFIGGGGELAYWLEMKGVYEAVGVPYPVLLLRNSFLLISPEQKKVMDKLGLSPKDLFLPLHKLQDLLLENSGQAVDLENELHRLQVIYGQLQQKAAAVDPTLNAHVAALYKGAQHKAQRLQTKMKSSQRKKLKTETSQIQLLKQHLFPGGSLQERTENVAGFYSRYGSCLLDIIKEASGTTEQQFGIIYLPETERPDPRDLGRIKTSEV